MDQEPRLFRQTRKKGGNLTLKIRSNRSVSPESKSTINSVYWSWNGDDIRSRRNPYTQTNQWGHEDYMWMHFRYLIVLKWIYIAPNARYRQSTLIVSYCVTLEKKNLLYWKVRSIYRYYSVRVCLYARVNDIVIKYIYPLREEKNKGACRSRCGRLVSWVQWGLLKPASVFLLDKRGYFLNELWRCVGGE